MVGNGPEQLSPADLSTRIARHLGRLNAMFGRKGVATLPSEHPARLEASLLEAFSANQRAPAYRDVEFLVGLTTAISGLWYWPELADEADPWSFFKSADVRNKYRNLIRDPGQYMDAVCELYTWGRLAQSALEVVPLIASGLPDFIAVCPSEAVAVEVKHLRVGASTSTVNNAVKKASTQLGEIAGIPGLVYLYMGRAPGRISLDDRVPGDIAALHKKVQGLLRGTHNRNVSAAVIVYDDVLLGDYGGRHATAIMRRRSDVIRHEGPWRMIQHLANEHLLPTSWMATAFSRPKLNEPLFETAAVPATPVVYDDLIVTELFRRVNEFGDGLRAEQAIEVMADPDEFEEVGSVARLALRHVSHPEHHVLVIGARKAAKTEILAGFRLAASPQGGSWTPREALNVLVERFGVPSGVDGGEMHLLNVDIAAPQRSLDFEVADALSIGVLDRGRLSLLFAVDVPKYLSAARALAPQPGQPGDG